MNSLVKTGATLLRNLGTKSFLPNLQAATMSSDKAVYNFETLALEVPKLFVYHVQLNRPQQLNAMNGTMWLELGKCFEQINDDEDCRVVILSAAGKLFTAGLDFKHAMQWGAEVAQHEDVARKAKVLRSTIEKYQKSISSLEICRKPVIAAVHGACIGGGVDLITATDIRYCSNDAWFQIKEVDIGMAADVGTLQRLPKIVGSDSLVRELCYTGRKVNAEEAFKLGLVSKVFGDRDSLIAGALALAEEIASKSPVAVQGTKESLVYSRDHTVQEGLDHIALRNQAMLQSEDFLNATVAQATKNTDVQFSKL